MIEDKMYPCKVNAEDEMSVQYDEFKNCTYFEIDGKDVALSYESLQDLQLHINEIIRLQDTIDSEEELGCQRKASVKAY